MTDLIQGIVLILLAVTQIMMTFTTNSLRKRIEKLEARSS